VLITRTTILASTVIATVAAQAQTYTVLHRFTGSPDGAGPLAGLIADPAGNLFGTTPVGGASGWGTVFKVDNTGEKVLYSFPAGPAEGETGGGPAGGLIRDSAGNFFGTTQEGGASNAGTVFKLDTAGNPTILYSFTGGADGGLPLRGVIRDAAGNLYGTTYAGGQFTNTCQFRNGCGVVFKIDPAGAYNVLYFFRNGPDGAQPMAGLIRDSEGNLYGTTQHGGVFDFGTVFRLDKSGVTVLHSFRGGTDGVGPYAGLIRDQAGNLYGTTYVGGASGGGTVFKVDTADAETVLYSFAGGADGGYPAAGLAMDSAGNLYGTTQGGGVASWYSGYGVVFEVQLSGMETVLYTFTQGSDGGVPSAALTLDSAGNLYGTTQLQGGYTGRGEFPFGCGVVFKIAP
jgi:uncharacterized repeat protein (TIGR03803 family)